MRGERTSEAQHGGHDPSVLTALAIGALFVPFLGVAIGTIDMTFGNSKRMSQGLWLFVLGLVPLAALAVLRFS